MWILKKKYDYWWKKYGLEKTDRATKTSLFDRNWAISLKPRWRSRPLRLVWWALMDNIIWEVIQFVFITGSPGKPGKPKAFIEGSNVVIRWTNGTKGKGHIMAYYIQANNIGELFEILKLFLCNMMLYLDQNALKTLKLNTCTVTLNLNHIAGCQVPIKSYNFL